MDKPKILSGFRDSLPSDMIERNRLIEKIRETFELFGFDPIETPSLEYYSTLAGKEGGDSEMLMYNFEDLGKRHVGLIYDLTVPVSRMIATNPEIAMPFKRYQIQRVWRADRPQKGRYREFHQCDVDIFGDEDVTADAEIVTVISSALSNIGFENFVININSREILDAILTHFSVADDKKRNVIIEIDKLDKIGADGVTKELDKIGVSNGSEIIDLLSFEGTSEEKLEKFTSVLSGDEAGANALAQVARIIKLAKLGGAKVTFDPSLARGQSYYTGPVFEAKLTDIKFGSIAGGGRYDKLVGIFSGREIPAVGASLGFDRILAAMKEIGISSSCLSVADVYILHFGESTLEYSLRVASKIRESGINVITGYGNKKMKWQMKHAVSKGVKAIVIIGEDEVSGNSVTIKDTNTREQKTITFDELSSEMEKICK